jgi:hypothetical protein
MGHCWAGSPLGLEECYSMEGNEMAALEDGRWFEDDKAKAFEADYYYHPNGDPDRPICLATGNEYSRETLLLTDEGTLVLKSECFLSGMTSYSEMTLDDATRWLIANGHQSKLAQLELKPEEAKLRC